MFSVNVDSDATMILCMRVDDISRHFVPLAKSLQPSLWSATCTLRQLASLSSHRSASIGKSRTKLLGQASLWKNNTSPIPTRQALSALNERQRHFLSECNEHTYLPPRKRNGPLFLIGLGYGVEECAAPIRLHYAITASEPVMPSLESSKLYCRCVESLSWNHSVSFA